MRVVIAMFLSLVVAAAAAPAQKGQSPASTAKAIEQAEALIAKGIEDARAKFAPDAPRLVADVELNRIARLRSEAMAKRIAPFAHEDAKGRPAATDLMRERISPYGAFGENIMMASRGRTPFDPVSFAKIAVDGWLKSPSHRANILAHDFDHAGIGVAINGTEAYATQVFMGPPRSGRRPR